MADRVNQDRHSRRASGPMCLWHLPPPLTSQKLANICDRCKWCKISARSSKWNLENEKERETKKIWPNLSSCASVWPLPPTTGAVAYQFKSRHFDVPSCCLICLKCVALFFFLLLLCSSFSVSFTTTTFSFFSSDFHLSLASSIFGRSCLA